MKKEEVKLKTFDILHFVADNAGLSIYEAIEKAYNMGVSKKEPCEDCISRQKVLDEAFEVYTKEYGMIDVVGVDAIDALPPVIPQSKTGYWVNGEYCSECGCDVPAYIIDWR